MRQNEEFTPLRVVRKSLTDFDRSAYRVYKSPSEYITVDAATALEAFRESGIRKPLRIVRETRFMERLIDQSRFADMEEVVETGVIMEAPMNITGHQEAVPQAAPRAPMADAASESAAPTHAPMMDAPPAPERQPEHSEEPVAEQAEDGYAEDFMAEALNPPAAEPAHTQPADSELSEAEIEALLNSGESPQNVDADASHSGEEMEAAEEQLSAEEVEKLLGGGE